MKSFLSLSTNKDSIASNGEIDSIFNDFYYVIGKMNQELNKKLNIIKLLRKTKPMCQ